MRIPEETVFRFFTRKTRQTPAEEQAPEPVDGLAASRDAPAHERSRTWQKQAEEATAQRQARAYEEQQHAGEERRKHDRRKKKQDVLLDTRTAPASTIDVKA